jgi:hypothetical protein
VALRDRASSIGFPAIMERNSARAPTTKHVPPTPRPQAGNTGTGVTLIIAHRPSSPRSFWRNSRKLAEMGYGQDWLYGGWFQYMLHQTHPRLTPDRVRRLHRTRRLHHDHLGERRQREEAGIAATGLRARSEGARPKTLIAWAVDTGNWTDC